MDTERTGRVPLCLKFANCQLQFPIDTGWEVRQTCKVVFDLQRFVSQPATLLVDQQDGKPLIRIGSLLLPQIAKHIRWRGGGFPELFESSGEWHGCVSDFEGAER